MKSTEEAGIEEEQRYRASAWALLAALLRAVPDRALLDHVGKLSPDGDDESDDLHEAMSNLAKTTKPLRYLVLNQPQKLKTTTRKNRLSLIWP